MLGLSPLFFPQVILVPIIVGGTNVDLIIIISILVIIGQAVVAVPQSVFVFFGFAFKVIIILGAERVAFCCSVHASIAQCNHLTVDVISKEIAARRTQHHVADTLFLILKFHLHILFPYHFTELFQSLFTKVVVLGHHINKGQAAQRSLRFLHQY